MSKDKAIDWVFESSPASGARTGGNVAEYAFRPDIDTFVREVVQNVLDNTSSKHTKAKVTFRLIQLSGKPLDDFLLSLNWSKLRPHIDAAECVNHLRQLV